MKVLVTGAGGFLGRYVVAALGQRGHSVRALIRMPRDGRPFESDADVESVHADLCLSSDLAEALDGVEVVVHLAAQLKGDDESRISETMKGTSWLVSEMAKHGVTRLVLASSFSVYDWRGAPAELCEDSPLDLDGVGRDGYAIAKIRQEQLVRAAAEKYGWELTILRPGAIWGPKAQCPPIIGQSVGPLHFVVAGSRMLPLTHVENCADAFAAVVGNAKAIGQTFNVVDEPQISAWRTMGQYLRRSGRGGIRIPVSYGTASSVIRLAYMFGKPVLGRRMPSILTPRRFEARFKPMRFASGKLQRLLGWAQRLTYDECVERTFRAPAIDAETLISVPTDGGIA